MPKPLLRKTLLSLVLLAVITGAVIVALPFAASTHLVRDRIGQEISFWTGYNVDVGARPEIEVWPSLRAVLHDVSFSDPDTSAPAVLHAERVEIDMSAVAALRGSIDFKRVRLINPVVHLEAAGDDYRSLLPRGGKISRSVQAARVAREAEPIKPDPAALPKDAFGTVEFLNGQVVLQNQSRTSILASDLSGAVEWPALNRRGSLNLEGLWNGERLALKVESAQPLLHLAGGTSELQASLTSSRLTAAFDGRAGLDQDGLVDGTLRVATPSVRGAVDWLHPTQDLTFTEGALEFNSQVSGTPGRLKFNNASLLVAGSPGIGSLELSWGQTAPVLSGGMAFETIDLAALLALFSPVLPDGAPVGTSRLPALAFDLRLSASVATVGTVTLNEVAATAQVRPGLTVLDLSDATAFGGIVQAGLRVTPGNGSNMVELRMLATDINGQAAGDALGLARLLPTSRGTLSLMLTGNGANWQEVFGSASGTFSADFAAGTLRQFDLQDFLRRLQEGAFFAINDVAEGTVPIEALQLKAIAQKGIAQIGETTVRTANNTILINGIVPYDGGLALTGSVHAAGAQIPAQIEGEASAFRPLAAFFVGGSWSAPFVSPATPWTMP
ncbi:MAG TPA: AsmA-like C-terminal region-containing protein [Tianweitania sediminis]|jgi:AsmA protein|nr:AsmA-like C-terminal region-containing protein [Tianweitania sediminis]